MGHTQWSRLFFKIQCNGTEVYSSRLNPIDDFTGTSFTWTITGNLNLDFPADQYSISLHDFDFPDSDDLIGGVNFTPFIEANGRPGTISLDCTGCEVVFRFDVEYVD